MAGQTFWHLVTRLGEAQVLLPLALGLALLLWQRGSSPRLALGWIGWIAVVAAITTASKVAFLGWGVGSAALDFTGISGHAMFSAAIYPVLLRLLPAGRGRRAALWRALGVSAGVMLAALVAASRLMVDAHSLSEVVTGMALGLAASALTLRLATPADSPRAGLPRWVPALVATWLVLLPHGLPTLGTHALVTELALSLSGRSVPYVRRDLVRRTEDGSAPGTRPLRFDAATADPRSLAPRNDRPSGPHGGFHHS